MSVNIHLNGSMILLKLTSVQHIDQPTHESGHLFDYKSQEMTALVRNIFMYLILSVIT